MRFAPVFLDDLRSRIRLSDWIGREVRLERCGQEYIGLCPFHNEWTPSFTVRDDRQFVYWLASEDRTMPKGGPAALGGADRMDIGRGEPLGTARKGRAQDQILADERQQNRHQSQLIHNLRRVYGYGFIATGGLAIELAVRVGGLSVPRGALKEICEWARSPPVANSPVPRGSRCRRRE
jgi:hypothetical protein